MHGIYTMRNLATGKLMLPLYVCVCVNVYFYFILNCALLICNSPLMILYA